MRVLTHVVELARLGGIEVNLLESTRALVAAGHEVHAIFGPDRHSSGRPLQAELESAGVTLHGPHPFGWSLPHTVRDVRSYGPAAELAARLQPDVLWLHRFEHVLWGRTVARRARVPLVCHLHHVPNFRRRFTPVLARGVDRFVAVSEYMRERWVDAGIAPERISVVHNAVSEADYPVGRAPERSAARAALGLPDTALVALDYGRLEPDKGIGTVLDAWDAPALDGAHLLLAGEVRPDDVTTRERVRALVERGRATLLPVQADVVPLLHASDLVLFPSLLPESFGRVALEALMTGRPVLASRVGGVPEVLAGPLEELLVPPGDAAALAAATAGLLDWRTSRPGLGEECADAARRRFSFAGHVAAVTAQLQASADRAAGQSGRSGHGGERDGGQAGTTAPSGAPSA